MNKPNWTQDDAVALRTFYADHRHIIEVLRSKKPKAEGKTFEESVINSKTRDGFDLAIEELERMMEDVSDPFAPTGFVEVNKD